MATPSHDDLANALRALAMDAVEKAKSGHPGMPMGMADAATVLFRDFLKFDAADPDWPDRDRFILSNGHGSMLLYGLLHLTGFEDMTLEELKRFRQVGSKTAGHPEYGHAKGIETTTGPLGQGIANAVGFALAERHLAARFGEDVVDHHTWVFAGDGCLMEGISHEAIGLAGHLKLHKLKVVWDDNAISIDGPTDLATSEDVASRFRAAGWAVLTCDGHDEAALKETMAAALETDRPTLIAARTIIGFGAPTKANTAKAHGAPLGAEEIAGAREKLGWSHPPFEIPAAIGDAWRAIGRRGAAAREAWATRVASMPATEREELERVLSGALPEGLADVVAEAKAALVAEAPALATRKASERALKVLTAAVPEMVGGSADLTGSNNTRAGLENLDGASYGGRYVHYGIREHGMAAAMNGLALHGGVRPYGGTFLVFTDYCRPSIRLSALMRTRVQYVMTHDSIGLGEDGPTHQPIEHLMALRAIPHLAVFRPADAVETLEAWDAALRYDGPSVLALSRQGLPALRTAPVEGSPTARGAYVLQEPDGARDVTLLATGSEVSMAVEAAAILAGDGIRAAVVSMPCWELFEAQDAGYRARVLGQAPRVSVEAGLTFGWEKWIDDSGRAIGLTDFGASGPGREVYAHFGLTAQAVAEAARTTRR
jgi:transketolase